MNRSAGYFERMGRRLWLRGEYYRALKLMQEGLALYPGEPTLKLGLAMAQLRLGNFAIARDALSEILAATPDSGDALVALCEAYLNLGKKHEALGCARKAETSHPDSPMLLQHLAIILLEHGLFKEAAYYFKKSIAADPSRAYAHLGLGIAYSGLHMTDRAVEEIRTAMSLRKNFYEAMSYLGNMLYDKGDKAAAVKLFMQIPVAYQNDPITVSRLIEHCQGSKKCGALLSRLKTHFKKIVSGNDINEFLVTLEKHTFADGAIKQSRGSSRFIKTSREIRLSGEQQTLLAGIEKSLKALFGKPFRPGPISRLPEVRSSSSREAGEFLGLCAAYIKQVSESVKSQPAAPMTRWAQAWGLNILAPYIIALLRHMYLQRRDYGVSQNSVDSIVVSLVNILKWMPPGLRGSEWLVELGGVIMAFWTYADMLERLFLVREILNAAEKKSVEPIVARGRAWRRWLGFQSDAKWPYLAAELFSELPKTYGAGQPVRCVKCKAIIKDYWDIAQQGDSPLVRCGNCAPVLRCAECGGPTREVSAGKGKSRKTVCCMECRKRHAAAK